MSWYAPSLNSQVTDLELSMDGMSTPCKKLHRLSQAGLYADPDFAAQINVLDQAAAQFLLLTPHPDDVPPEQLDSFRRHRQSLIQAIATVKSAVDQKKNFCRSSNLAPSSKKLYGLPSGAQCERLC